MVNFISHIINPVSNLLIALYVVNTISLEAYGQLSVQLALFFSISVLGKFSTWQHTHHELGRLTDISQFDFIKNEIIQDFFCYLLVCLLVLIAFFTVHQEIFRPLEIMVILCTGFFHNNGILLGKLRQEEQYLRVLYIYVTVFSLKVVMLFIAIHYSYQNIIILISLSELFGWSLFFIYYFFGNLRSINLFGLDLNEISSSLYVKKFSLYLTNVISLPVQQFDKLILSAFLSLDLIGIYNLAQRSILFFSVLIEPLVSTTMKSTEGINAFRISNLISLRYFLVALIIQLPVFVGLHFGYDVVNEYLFDNKISGIKFILEGYYLAYMLSSCFYWVHIYSVKYLGGGQILISMIISVIIFIVAEFSLVLNYGLGGAFAALILQYFSIIIIRLFLLKIKIRANE